MSEFGRGGRLRKRATSQKLLIIRQAVEIINAHKIYSVSCCMKNEDYKMVFSDELKEHHSQYKLCFT